MNSARVYVFLPLEYNLRYRYQILVPTFFKRLFLLFVLSLFILSCDKKIVMPVQQLDQPPIEIVSLDQQKMQSVDLAISQFSPIQANQSGLYITPSHCKDDSVLFRLSKNPTDTQNLHGVLARGNSTNEAERILFSTKSVQDDSLVFYSGASAKLLTVGNNGHISQMGFTNKQLSLVGYSFAYNNNHLVLSIEPLFNKKYLLSIINIRTGETINAFPPRVPNGYQPAERNHISTMTAVPGGVVFAFTGDRKFYYMNYEGDVLREIVLGKSDPIPQPFTTQEPDTLERSSHYIKKMDFEDQFLHVLMDEEIWLLDIEQFKPITRLQFTHPITEQIIPIEDFSIAGRTLYLKQGKSSFTQLQRKDHWYDAVNKKQLTLSEYKY